MTRSTIPLSDVDDSLSRSPSQMSQFHTSFTNHSLSIVSNNVSFSNSPSSTRRIKLRWLWQKKKKGCKMMSHNYSMVWLIFSVADTTGRDTWRYHTSILIVVRFPHLRSCCFSTYLPQPALWVVSLALDRPTTRIPAETRGREYSQEAYGWHRIVVRPQWPSTRPLRASSHARNQTQTPWIDSYW